MQPQGMVQGAATAQAAPTGCTRVAWGLALGCGVGRVGGMLHGCMGGWCTATGHGAGSSPRVWCWEATGRGAPAGCGRMAWGVALGYGMEHVGGHGVWVRAEVGGA